MIILLGLFLISILGFIFYLFVSEDKCSHQSETERYLEEQAWMENLKKVYPEIYEKIMKNKNE